jgi:hypothetical protein
MAFRDFAEQAVAQGIGRRISRDEATAILKANPEDGLVFLPSNAKPAQIKQSKPANTGNSECDFFRKYQFLIIFSSL